MKRNKTQNGITLIALILTVVILVILAGVAISEMSGNGIGILKHAETAHNKAQNLVSNTQQQQDAYLDYLKNELGGNDPDGGEEEQEPNQGEGNTTTTCSHESGTYTVYSAGDGILHYLNQHCSKCNEFLGDLGSESCEGDGCSKCGYTCKHTTSSYSYTDIYPLAHTYVAVCDSCQKEITDPTTVAHTYDSNGYCICGYKKQTDGNNTTDSCSHNNTTISYGAGSVGGHYIFYYCNDCELYVDEDWETHTLPCSECNYISSGNTGNTGNTSGGNNNTVTCNHRYGSDGTNYWYYQVGNGTHYKYPYCDDCGELIGDVEIFETCNKDNNGRCTGCRLECW